MSCLKQHRPAEDPSNWAGYISSLPGQGSHLDDSSEVSDNFVMPLAFRCIFHFTYRVSLQITNQMSKLKAVE